LLVIVPIELLGNAAQDTTPNSLGDHRSLNFEYPPIGFIDCNNLEMKPYNGEAQQR
jgi:hypothetical protein